jgi:hypothetical protein
MPASNTDENSSSAGFLYSILHTEAERNETVFRMNTA